MQLLITFTQHKLLIYTYRCVPSEYFYSVLLVLVLKSNMDSLNRATPLTSNIKIQSYSFELHHKFARPVWGIKSFKQLLSSFLFASNNKWLSCTNVFYTSFIRDSAILCRSKQFLRFYWIIHEYGIGLRNGIMERTL